MTQTIELPEPSITREQAKRWGPKIVHEQVPVFATKYDAEKYRDRELQRMIEGYNGCTGDHYDYVQHWKLKDGYGATIRPNWRDTDGVIIFPTLQECDVKKKDDFVLKRREVGLSSVAGYRANKYAMKYPGSVINITSYTDAALEKLMKQKIRFMGEHAYEEVEKEWAKVFGNKKTCFKAKTQWHESSKTLRYIDPDMGSIIQGIQTTQSERAAKNMEGDRIMFAFIDEFFLHPYATKVFASADASRKMGFANIGRISLGGSAGDATEDGANRARDLWNNHETLGINVIFIPGYMSIDVAQEIDNHGRPIEGSFISFTQDGWTLANEAREWIHKTRKILYSLADKSFYWQFVKAYPLDVEEIFETVGTGVWDTDEKARFEKKKKWIGMNPQHCMKPVVLQDSMGGEIKVKHVSESCEMMLEAPIQGELYIAGIDPTPITARKESDKSSMFSLAIKRFSTQQYVYYYMERTKDPSRMAGKTLRALKFFNDAKVMIERNRGDVILTEMIRQGFSHLICKEPPPLRPRNSKYIEFGYVKHVHNMDFLASNLQNWARFYDEDAKIGGIESIDDLFMLEQVYTFDVGNKDLADAIISCELYNWWIREYNKREEEYRRKRDQGSQQMMPYVTYDNQGRRIQRLIPKQASSLGTPIQISKNNRYGKFSM